MNSTMKYFKEHSSGKYFEIMGENIGKIKTKSGYAVVFFPNSSEYIITEDVITTAHKLNCKIITYASTWGSKTQEADMKARQLGLQILVLGALFSAAK